ncbi:uncharacterized protein BX664DRAFT_321198 [Halteromyces radiatus]|uniref:uncharacterized protein n=1 Tax=Halteromyces radiatus TaxID=101107 RepID=UPI002220B60B|nr:uncharacterized protein BX664DRAFT_321198 [Halteromyces radiatus]KAI8099416.1 hypothetical protein BX664DRAFT_321198 [Halteromyces radiatus]
MGKTHPSTVCLVPDSCSELLLIPALAAARDAVHLDTLGQYKDATHAYHRVIQIFETVLTSDCAGMNGHVNREQILQKSNEYLLRIKQLDRYTRATTTSSHPDAFHFTIHSPFGNEQDATAEEHSEEEEDFERSDIDIAVEKAQFSMGQGELNEYKEYLDNALMYYSDAAEWYLKAFKALDVENGSRTKMRERFLEAMEKAENLKTLQQNKLHHSTSLLSIQNDKPSSARSRSPSCSSSQGNIPVLMNGNDTSHPNGGNNSIHRRTSSTAASSIKSHSSQPFPSLSPSNPTDDIATQRLSAAEIEVLKTTSNVNNRVFLPWMDESDLKECFSYPDKFLDSDGPLKLSEKQLSSFGAWKRPSDFMKHPELIRLISSTSIIQDVVTDCSFVASLCVAAAYERKFGKQLITSCIYPQNKQGIPCYNPSGKYVIKLVYNGIARKVVDDLLPISRENTLMCTFSTNKEEIWSSIIEKAYMKLMGGYDFPGSNSGIDLYCLTGWIPEHIFINDKQFNPDKVWNRILDGAKYGDVLVTIATGEMTEEEATKTGLVPTHAYAVIDIKSVMGVRFLQVKNPWSHKRWCGPYSHLDTTQWTPELMEALNFDPSVAEQIDDGIFWIDLESVCDYFTSIHLNWNPELFTYRWVLHSVWLENFGPKKDVYNLGYNPQFSLTVTVPDQKPAAVRLLLSKHIMVTEENTDYITLHVYNDTNGERIYYPDEPFKEGTYVNSPHILVRFNAPPGTSNYTIVVSQHEKKRSLFFSLRAYSLAPFKLCEVPFRYPIEQKISGQWTDQTAGGNASNASYMHNPQWKITIPPTDLEDSKTGLLLMLDADKTFAIHLLLVEGGKRATSVSVRDILVESGPYRHGFCYCEMETIKPGVYTVVASTFEADLIGEFVLTASSNIPLTIETIPAEGAGMFRKIINGEWILGYSAMGCPSYGSYGKNPRYLLEVRELTTIRVRLQADKIDPVPSTNVTIYERHPTELFGQEIATSGPYTNVIQGVTTGDVILSQNETGYIIVFATHDQDVSGEFSAILYSDRPVNIRNDR